MFYTYGQNNSGGIFRPPANYVIIEANSPSDSDYIAEFHGLYFDGCDNNRDCSCCGDRWYRASDYDAYTEPSIYGKPASEFVPHFRDKNLPVAMIVFSDGRIESIQ